MHATRDRGPSRDRSTGNPRRSRCLPRCARCAATVAPRGRRSTPARTSKVLTTADGRRAHRARARRRRGRDRDDDQRARRRRRMKVIAIAIATAPGKLILMGEYAVLDGAPAVVVAVDRRVIARRHIGPARQLAILDRRRATRSRRGLAVPGSSGVHASADARSPSTAAVLRRRDEARARFECRRHRRGDRARALGRQKLPVIDRRHVRVLRGRRWRRTASRRSRKRPRRTRCLRRARDRPGAPDRDALAVDRDRALDRRAAPPTTQYRGARLGRGYRRGGPRRRDRVRDRAPASRQVDRGRPPRSSAARAVSSRGSAGHRRRWSRASRRRAPTSPSRSTPRSSRSQAPRGRHARRSPDARSPEIAPRARCSRRSPLAADRAPTQLASAHRAARARAGVRRARVAARTALPEALPRRPAPAAATSRSP